MNILREAIEWLMAIEYIFSNEGESYIEKLTNNETRNTTRA